MTPEEIRKLAKSLCATSNPTQDDVWLIEDIIEGILRTHCIVSKEKVAEIKEDRCLKEYEFLKERCIEDLNPERMDWHDMYRLCDGMYYALKQLLDETDK